MRGISKDQQRKVQRQKCLELKSRLERGWDMCDANPDDKRLEDHWLRLLKQYEQAVFTFVTLGGKTSEV